MGAPRKQQPDNSAYKMPQSPEAETALLGCILFEPEVMNVVFDEVKPEDFYEPAHRAVAQVVWDYWDGQKQIAPALILDELRRRKQDAVAGGHEGLMRIADSVPEASHAKQYARIVADKAQLRVLILAAEQMKKLALSDSGEVADTLGKAEGIIGKAIRRRTIKSAVKVSEQVPIEIRNLVDTDKKILGIPSGFADLDDVLTGLHPGELTIVAARPGMGKTSLVLNIARNFALEQSRPVLMFSPETKASQITRNLLAMQNRISVHKMRKLSLSQEDKVQLALSVARFENCEMFIDDETEDIGRVRSVARHLNLRQKLALIVLDYLQLLCHEIKYKRQEIEEISRSLKRLSVELDVPIVAVSQLNRAVEQRGRRVSQKQATKYLKVGETTYMPILSDLRESGAIEQDADNVLLLYRQDYYRTSMKTHDHIAHLRVAKQRHGPPGQVRLTFLEKFLRFENHIEDEDGEGEVEDEPCAETRTEVPAETAGHKEKQKELLEDFEKTFSDQF